MFNQNKIYSKIEENFHLSNKKALFFNMKNYYEAVGEDMSNCLPLIYHIKNRNDSEFQKFVENFQKSKA